MLSILSVRGLHLVCPTLSTLAHKVYFSNQHIESRLCVTFCRLFTSPSGVTTSRLVKLDAGLKHLNLFLSFCPIFLLLESGRACKSLFLCPGRMCVTCCCANCCFSNCPPSRLCPNVKQCRVTQHVGRTCVCHISHIVCMAEQSSAGKQYFVI